MSAAEVWGGLACAGASGVAVVLAGVSFSISVFQPVLQLLERPLEFGDALAERLADLRQPTRPEYDQAITKMTSSSGNPIEPSIHWPPGRSLQGHSRATRPSARGGSGRCGRRLAAATTRLMLHSDEPIAIAITLIAAAPIAPNTRPAIPGVSWIAPPTTVMMTTLSRLQMLSMS